ncbi:tRNA (adenosine(37)-N6)-threonylcarbamoyltransferase complex ATPase subunit type 1 TsaE [Candidatus Chazhemtobacterium aquaticus]|uniref:tRNA threonylcarbamoyladenosine biosynthesis protein TsaE n=1 Tax=Candidatus Chazhemtobacterium aquaticus TaxID=2715735 RepID=A0A857N592_9BACT|nr:tRNA (adenosine(37)-N6)-threonylcarbamoyltransferase complex ATPase subunit type 1 TsaE [Candidatus Chazhemtobacterium aquaticus]QHO63415.1 TsaE protein, required for threonylcarbamoyladenosine t(6)A37 formation in tRNA [Candidatus Chazhemtobacterium aquaticus]
MTKTFVTHSSKQTQQIGKDMAASTLPGHPIVLMGDLGSGKTTFVQGFGSYFGFKRMTSPTYTFIKSYKITSQISENTSYWINHVDLYRAATISDIHNLGIPDLLHDPLSWTLIEWPELILNLLPKKTIIIKFTQSDKNMRKIVVSHNQTI